MLEAARAPVDRVVLEAFIGAIEDCDDDYIAALLGRGPGTLEPEALNDTNTLELRVFGSGAHGQAVLVARLDNLGKGASGAAVQNIRPVVGG